MKFLKNLGICVIIVVAIIMTFQYSQLKNGSNKVKNIPEKEVQDIVVQDEEFFGYTAATFQDAILGNEQQTKVLEVYSVELADVLTISKTGLADLEIFNKVKELSYRASVQYTIDLASMTADDILYDDVTNTLTITIPDVKQSTINPTLNDISTTEKGILAFGDIKLTAEDYYALEKQATDEMQARLDELSIITTAEKFAVHSAEDIYEPIVHAIDSSINIVVK